jgi:hypothetical protein
MGEATGDWRELAAKQAIRDVLASYCRSMDRMDRDLALGVWHEGGTCEYVDMFEGTGAGFVDWVWEQHEGMLRHSHQITNVNIAVDVDAGRAVSEAYVTVALWAPPADAPTEIISRGRYLDRWSLRDGRWAVDHRVYLQDLMTMAPVPADAVAGASARSTRDEADPSYELFASLG